MIFVIFSLFDLLSKIRRFFLLFIFVISNFILSLYQTKQNIMETNYFIFKSQLTGDIIAFACCNEDVEILCHQDDISIRKGDVLYREYFEENEHYEECTRQEFMNEFTKLQKKINGLIKEI